MLCAKLGDLFDICHSAKLDPFKMKRDAKTASHDHKEWARNFMDAVKSLCKMEKNKHSMPKFYRTLYPLATRVRQDYITYRDFLQGQVDAYRGREG